MQAVSPLFKTEISFRFKKGNLQTDFSTLIWTLLSYYSLPSVLFQAILRTMLQQVAQRNFQSIIVNMLVFCLPHRWDSFQNCFEILKLVTYTHIAALCSTYFNVLLNIGSLSNSCEFLQATCRSILQYFSQKNIHLVWL